MITNDIIKIASNTSNVGLTNKYTFKSTKKNSICGDLIKIELISKNSKIYSMKYETESCVYCEASASLLSKIIKNMHIGILKKELNNLKNISKSDVDYIFTKNFIEFKFLINKNNINRFNCIFLPIDAVLKALKL
jgi:nitrogen fixation NifU-like protein|tara:strand:+ start:291 stop:695 length:405 start_codon:yes stop_codon:yes gene_type:complete